MRAAVLENRDPRGDWSEWRRVWIVGEGAQTYRIWSWRNPFTRLVHKRAIGERINQEDNDDH